jgi:hypothetical protein
MNRLGDLLWLVFAGSEKKTLAEIEAIWQLSLEVSTSWIDFTD